MAKINTLEIIRHLEVEIRKSLDATIREHFPDQEFNSRAVYKSFSKQIDMRCKSWEDVPNKFLHS